MLPIIYPDVAVLISQQQQQKMDPKEKLKKVRNQIIKKRKKKKEKKEFISLIVRLELKMTQKTVGQCATSL